MALVTCKECGAGVSTKAVACPTCGAKQRHTSGCTKALAWIIGIFMLFVVGSLVINPSSSTSESSSQTRTSNVDQVTGRQFIGLTKQQLIDKLGAPIKTTKGSNPQDGNFEILTYDNSNVNATLFTIWENDGYVSSGQYQGKYFYEKQ